jgi:TolA-binding protein
MDLAGNTSFRVDSQGEVERFSLQHGALSAHVAKLAQGQRFIVTTPDAEIEVRGTRFRLNVLERGQACGAGTRSRLDVSEGVVEVRAAGAFVSVKAGQHWPADCAVAADSSAEQSLGDRGENRATAPSTTDASAPRSAPQPVSALTQQNDLFAEGVALRRQGDVHGALRAYQDVIARYPNSPLAENAMVERMRLLKASQSPRARDEAKRYLARYPRGFALQEAQHLLEPR